MARSKSLEADLATQSTQLQQSQQAVAALQAELDDTYSKLSAQKTTMAQLSKVSHIVIDNSFLCLLLASMLPCLGEILYCTLC